MSLDLVSPEAVGVDPVRLDLLLRRARLEVESGALPSVQIAVASAGRLVAFETIGASSDDRRYVLQSVGRTVVAAVIWKLLGEGALRLDEHIADIVPEFAANGKRGVQLLHVLTHTAGFAFAPLGYPRMLERDQRLEAFARWRLDTEPGARLQFHLTGAAWLLAELVERRTGRSFPEYLRAEILDPLGLPMRLPVPVDEFEKVLAVPVATDRTSDEERVDPWGPWYLADPEILAAGEPSHSIAATAAEVAMFLQALIHSGLWADGVVDDAIRIRRSEAPYGDVRYGGSPEIANMGLFCMVRGELGGPWTPRTGSPRTFGNAGAPCQMAFMDPDAGTSFAFLTNGYPLAGYDRTPHGLNRILNIGNLGNDLVSPGRTPGP